MSCPVCLYRFGHAADCPLRRGTARAREVDMNTQITVSALPSVRALAKLLRDTNAVYDGPGPLYLSVYGARGEGGWLLDAEPGAMAWAVAGPEHIPGDGAPFDATAAARRLISDLRWNMLSPSATAAYLC